MSCLLIEFVWSFFSLALEPCVVFVVSVLDKGKAHIEEVEYEETSLVIETVRSNEHTKPCQAPLPHAGSHCR